MATHEDIDPSALGPNMWLIDELYRRYREDPESVGPDWREFFEGFRPQLMESEASTPPEAETATAPAPSSAASHIRTWTVGTRRTIAFSQPRRTRAARVSATRSPSTNTLASASDI